MRIPVAACHSGGVGGFLTRTSGDAWAYWFFRPTASSADLFIPSGYAVRSPRDDTDVKSLWGWLILCQSAQRT